MKTIKIFTIVGAVAAVIALGFVIYSFVKDQKKKDVQSPVFFPERKDLIEDPEIVE